MFLRKVLQRLRLASFLLSQLSLNDVCCFATAAPPPMHCHVWHVHCDLYPLITTSRRFIRFGLGLDYSPAARLAVDVVCVKAE